MEIQKEIQMSGNGKRVEKKVIESASDLGTSCMKLSKVRRKSMKKM